MLLLLPERPSRLRLGLAGLTTALLVACRAIDVVFALVVLGWVAATHPGRLSWFLIAPLAVAVMLLSYNLSLFETLSGGQAALEAMHPEVHGVAGPWAGNPFEGLAGTLFSPSRGLFVYCPWVLLSVVLLPWTFRSLPTDSIVRWLVVGGLVGYLLLLSLYAVWWGGHTFGPRYWTDATPLFAVLLALGLNWCRERAWGLTVLYALTILIAVGIQAVGALLLSEFVEPVADEHRPQPRPPLGLGRYGVATLSG